jgi:hypothetical protein
MSTFSPFPHDCAACKAKGAVVVELAPPARAKHDVVACAKCGARHTVTITTNAVGGVHVSVNLEGAAPVKKD